MTRRQFNALLKRNPWLAALARIGELSLENKRLRAKLAEKSA